MHYLARMVEAGEDPRFIARRLMILASEDIGLADPGALPLAVAAAQAVQLIGMPEGFFALAHTTLALALAPKSNAVTRAMSAAGEDLRKGLIGAGARPPARQPLRPAPGTWATARGTSTPTTYPARSPPSSTAPTPSATGATTSRPGTAPRPATPTSPTASASSWAATPPHPPTRRARTDRAQPSACTVVELVETRLARGRARRDSAGTGRPGFRVTVGGLDKLDQRVVALRSISSWFAASQEHGGRGATRGRAPTVVELVETTPGPWCVHGRERPVRPRLGSSWLASGPTRAQGS